MDYNQQTPLVSVIVPIYNTGEKLSCQVDSILAQTLKDFELLLIDDGSTDGVTPQLCDKYGATDSRVRVFHKQNGGVSDSRNFGLNHAHGIFIAFADHDDYMFSDNLETMVKEATMSSCVGGYYDLVICRFHRCKREEINEEQHNNEESKILISASNIDEMYYAVSNMGYDNFVVWNQLFKRSIIENHQIRFIKENSEDEMFATEYFTHVSSFKIIDYKGYVFIYNDNSLGSSHNYIATYSWIARMESLYDEIIYKYHLNNDIYNWRIANRLAVLCIKGYYKDSHLPWRERMKVWNRVRTDKWLREKNIILSQKGRKNFYLVLKIAEYRLYYFFDPLFKIYGWLNS